MGGPGAALALDGTHTWTRRAELSWLLHAVLALGGVKMLIENLRLGRAATLIFSLGLYGTALILGPAIARGRRRADGQDP